MCFISHRPLLSPRERRAIVIVVGGLRCEAAEDITSELLEQSCEARHAGADDACVQIMSVHLMMCVLETQAVAPTDVHLGLTPDGDRIQRPGSVRRVSYTLKKLP